MSDVETEELIKKAVERHFVDWAYLPYNGCLLTLGDRFESQVDNLVQTRDHHVEKFEAYISGFSNDELLVAAGGRDIVVEGFGLRENELAELRKSAFAAMPERSRGKLIAMGSYPDELADYKHWALRDKFSNDEFVWLSIGLEPVAYLSDYLGNRSGKAIERQTDIGIEANRRKQIFDRSRDFDPIYKSVAIDVAHDWFAKVELATPDGFAQMLETGWKRLRGEIEVKPEKAAPNPADESPDPREIRSMARLITAIAIEEYGYDPKAKRGPIPKEIEGICALHGLEVTSDTIRRYLKIGSDVATKAAKD